MKPSPLYSAAYRHRDHVGRRLPGLCTGPTGRFSIPWIATGLLLLLWLTPAVYGAPPIFENNTPVGFSPGDSTRQENFILGQQVTVRADLSQAATPTYPVIGHFHNLERSKQVESSDVDGLRADIAVSSEGTIHMAWISQEVVSPVSTPAYYVSYARSEDGGKNFSTPASVSGSLRFDILTLNGSGTSFSTVDLDLDSRGNPRVAYAFNFSADGHIAKFSGNPDNIYFNYSENGGASWLPGNRTVVINDTSTVGNTQGRTTAFPRMKIDQRDNIYITYVRGVSKTGVTDDIMLVQMDRTTTPFSPEQIGSLGNTGSTGGVRITPDGSRQTGPDIAIGSGDVLHVVYFNDGTDDIEHKTLLADSWSTVAANGWSQDAVGGIVDDFVDEPTTNALETDADYFFPTVVVDKQSSPNKIYVLYKFGDDTYETIFFNNYTYDNAKGGNAGWNAGQAAPVWSTANTAVFSDDVNNYNIELEWTVTERVSAVVDDRLPTGGELHIAFTAGYSSGLGSAHDIYYGYYNGASWTLPEKVADRDAGTADGIVAADVYLSAPALAKYSDSSNLYLVFAGGTGEGLGVDGVTDVNHHAYFKVLGRAISSDDRSVPVGGFQYDLAYTPINPQSFSTEITNNLIYVHAADNADGSGLGATGKRITDGFLAGDWETVGTNTMGDDDKNFEGRFNEDNASTNEWGDDDDKIGLLVKLNVLGSDSVTNVQAVTNSTASAAGTGYGARTVRVATATSGASVVAGDFFVLGADIDIVDSNTAPVVSISEPAGNNDEASLSYVIRYELTDVDDDISTVALQVAFYFSPDSTLTSVQDIRIFGTLIANQNDDSSVFASGTDDFAEGKNQSYTWGDPSAALKGKLFASIHQVISGQYYIYLVADDQKNPPVFTRSPGGLTIKHVPIVDFVAPAGADSIDTGVRSGDSANPYDLDFRVRDFDRQGAVEVQLFYASASGLSSVSVYHENSALKFTLGKSLAGIRGVAFTYSDTLTSAHTEFTWDLTHKVGVRVGAGIDSQTVAEGSYYLYAVASDSVNITVGQSQAALIVKHSPSFTFYEPSKDTHREISSRSQPVYTIQWQKGRGDSDFDDDATIDFYFTTDNPATINYEDFPDSLLKDVDTRVLVKGLSEDAQGAGDMYVWDFRSPPFDVPRESVNNKVWLYAIISDDHGNQAVALGGALTMTHDPYISLLSSKLDEYTVFNADDVLRITWDDYLVDDGSGTDDAYIRLYASTNAGLTTLAALEGSVNGTTTLLLNSSNGNTDGTIRTIREDSTNFLDWNTRSITPTVPNNYSIYAAISKDPTFSNNSANTLSVSSAQLDLKVSLAATPNVSLSPSDVMVAKGDTATLDVMVYYPNPINLVQIVLQLDADNLAVVNESAPFEDLGEIFPGTTPIENSYRAADRQLRFVKSTFQGQIVGTATQPARLARFQLLPTKVGGAPSVVFSTGETHTVVGVVGRSDPVSLDETLVKVDPLFKPVARGTIEVWVELEGRTLGSNDHTSLLDVHLRLPGSAIDITDAIFIAANDDWTDTPDSVEVQNVDSQLLTLGSVPPGRYVLTVKDTSHISGRTDTFTVHSGETIQINNGAAGSEIGFYGSDLRGDPTSLLGGSSTGYQLVAGDVTEDNEINEDDVNLIIAVWSSSASPGNTNLNYTRADINNDTAVEATDLTVTTSNFGNSEGFGAPPVYKPVVGGDNGETFLEIHPLFDARQSLWAGREVEFDVQVRDLDDLAGYEFNVHYDPNALRLIPGGVSDGGIFAGNPHGAVFESRCREGELAVIGARIGKSWSAQEDAVLARLRFKILEEGGIESIRQGKGVLLTSAYQRQEVRWKRSLAELLLPARPDLEQNYPNPFNPSTAIPFALPRSGAVQLEIYDILGQKIRTLASGRTGAGYYTMVWNGRDDFGRQAAAGVYFYLLQTGDFRQTRKMTLIK